MANTTSTYTGQLLLMNTDKWKLKGTFTAYGITKNGQGTASGSGDLYWWDETLDGGDGGDGDWQLAQARVPFTASFTASGGNRKAAPGSFGIQIRYTPVASQPSTLPNSTPQPLKGGSIKAS